MKLTYILWIREQARSYIDLISRSEHNYIFKVMLYGDSKVGKSSFMRRFINNEFTSNYEPTIGVEYGSKVRRSPTRKSGVIKLQIWDNAGNEKFYAITKSYYKTANGLMIIFDITNKDSFKRLSYWIEETRSNISIPTIVVGMKSDLKNERKVTSIEAKQFCDSKKNYYILKLVLKMTLIFLLYLMKLVKRWKNSLKINLYLLILYNF